MRIGQDQSPFDPSNGYEEVAREFIARRSDSSIGVATVRSWATHLPPGADVLDIGCGHGVPISAALAAEGANPYGVDASPTLIAAFRQRFSDAGWECCRVEESAFFGRSFDAAIAWGLLFLLPPAAQADLIIKVAAALRPGGEFLFTAPQRACEWEDTLTGRTSVALGAEEYRRLIQAAGLELAGEYEDEGQNYYYRARKPGSGA